MKSNGVAAAAVVVEAERRVPRSTNHPAHPTRFDAMLVSPPMSYTKADRQTPGRSETDTRLRQKNVRDWKGETTNHTNQVFATPPQHMPSLLSNRLGHRVRTPTFYIDTSISFESFIKYFIFGEIKRPSCHSFGSPAIHQRSLGDPWLCVPRSRGVYLSRELSRS